MRTPYFEAERWIGTGELDIPTHGTMTALTCVQGTAQVRTRSGEVRLEQGRSAVIPALNPQMMVTASDADIYASRTRVG